MRNLMKQDKAITLIALVITIIVLLILAGVTIVTLTGDNGILQKAETAKKNSTDGEIEEKIKLEQLEYEIKKENKEVEGTFTDYILEKEYNGMHIGDKINYNELSNGEKTYKTDSSKGIGSALGKKNQTENMN